MHNLVFNGPICLPFMLKLLRNIKWRHVVSNLKSRTEIHLQFCAQSKWIHTTVISTSHRCLTLGILTEILHRDPQESYNIQYKYSSRKFLVPWMFYLECIILKETEWIKLDLLVHISEQFFVQIVTGLCKKYIGIFANVSFIIALLHRS